MPKLLQKTHEPDPNGSVLKVTPESAGWKYVGFEVFHLRPGQETLLPASEKENCLVLLGGHIHLTAGKDDFGIIGDRKNVFDQGKRPYAFYAPQGMALKVKAVDEVEIALCSAPGVKDHPSPRLIKPDDIPLEKRGQGTNSRMVHNILPDTGAAGRLLVVEVYTPGGHWSSYPPHKHDQDMPPHETQLEETYYHRLNPKQGFAFQRVYTDDRSIDETMSVEDGDVVLVPRGYHPVGAPHQYDLYYLNVMAGPVRQWIFKNDPAHEWMLKK